MSCLYILEIKFLVVAIVCKCFLPFCQLSFILFMVSFVVKKVVNFITHLFLFLLLFPWKTDVGMKIED